MVENFQSCGWWFAKPKMREACKIFFTKFSALFLSLIDLFSSLLHSKSLAIASGLFKSSASFSKNSVISTSPDIFCSVLKSVKSPLEIHYEDESLLVVYKPAGLIVHPASSHQKISLVHYLLAHTKNSSLSSYGR